MNASPANCRLVGQGIPRLPYFNDAEAALVAGGDKAILHHITTVIRTIGPRHILFGSDAVGSSALSPEKAAARFRDDIPLTAEEFAVIAANRLPFLNTP